MVLDAINHVKDHVDTTLSYRWSCHMAVCGSCGMMIDGEPKLACKAPVRDYANRKIRIEPLANFPIERDLVVVLDDFMEKLKRVKPYIIRKDEKPIEEGEYKQIAGRAEEIQAVHPVHQLPVLLRGLSAVRPDTRVHRSRGPDPGPSLQPGLPRPGLAERHEVVSTPKGSGTALSTATAPRSVPSTWTRPAHCNSSRSPPPCSGTRSSSAWGGNNHGLCKTCFQVRLVPEETQLHRPYAAGDHQLLYRDIRPDTALVHSGRGRWSRSPTRRFSTA